MLSRAVWALLREGYGSEDIALRLGVPLSEVRKCIATFRAQGGGKLRGMYVREKKRWREGRSA